MKMLPRNLGRYRLIDRIAVGGTAEVFRAVLETTDGFAKTVAIKTLLPQWVGNDELARLLVDEARVLCHLCHQSIVQVYELGEEEGIPFMAMEYVDGIDCARLLHDRARAETPTPLALSLHIVSQVLAALEFAHARRDDRGRELRIVHRDISPSNILLSRNGEVKITDFGIAKGSHRTQLTDAGQMRGKFAYMSPEQARGEALDRRSDIFSCGAVLFELLSGTRLFAGRSDAQVLTDAAHAHVDLTRLGGTPPCVRSVLMLALADRADARYESAGEMLRDVTAAALETGPSCTAADLAAFLQAAFPEERASAECAKADRTRATRVCVLSSGDGRGRRPATRYVLKGWRVAAALLLALGVLATHPASGSIPPRGEQQALLPAATEMPPRAAAADRKLPPPPPDPRGVVAIDSRPSGARGTLRLGDEEFAITTPFSRGDIPLSRAVAGQVRISLAGYKEHVESFELCTAANAFVREIPLSRNAPSSISIAARPWGMASIEGFLKLRETPVASVRVRPGAHLVTVMHPPSGARLARRIDVREGQALTCSADFSGKGSLSCR